MTVHTPRGVALERDGFSRDVSERLRYVGCDVSGMHRWLVDLDEHEWLAVQHGTMTVHVAVMPARTTVGIAYRGR